MEETVYTYDAFISYRHGGQDGRVAERLHKELENYVLPEDLRKIGFAKKLTRIFRDKEELPTSPNLGDNIHEALRASRFLIVICSKRTPESIWVNEEIEYFKGLGRQNHICTLLIDGDPKEAFSTALIWRNTEEDKAQEAIEPIAADIRAKTIRKSLQLLRHEKLRIIAPIIGCGYDELVNRQKKQEQKKRIRITAISVGGATVVCLIGFTLLSSWGNYAKNVAADELDNNLDSLSGRYSCIKNLYDSVNSEIKFNDQNMNDPTGFGQIAIPTYLKTSTQQNLDELQVTFKRYPINCDEKDQIHLPAFLDWNDQTGRNIKNFNDQLASLNDNFNQLNSDLYMIARNVNTPKLAITFEKTLLSKLKLYMVLSKVTYKVGMQALEPLNYSDYLKYSIDYESTFNPSSLDSIPSSSEGVSEDIASSSAVSANSSTDSVSKVSSSGADLDSDEKSLANSTTPEGVSKFAGLNRVYGNYEVAIAQYQKFKRLFASKYSYATQYADTGILFTKAIQKKEVNFMGGYYIISVASSSAAEKSGIEAGDILVTYNGKSVENILTFDQQIQAVTTATTDFSLLRFSKSGSFQIITSKISAGKMGIVCGEM